MTRTRLRLTVAASLSALVLTGCGGLSDDDRSAAEDAALAAVGTGRVTEVDEGDDDETAAFDVEVTLDSGESIDVELDEGFEVLNQGEIDSELAAEQGGSADAGASDAPSPSPTEDSASSTPSASPTTDDDTPLEGDLRRQAVEAARAEVGGGRVEEATYADRDERHAYEVDLELRGGGDDDDEVTVELDEDFNVVRVDR